MLLPPTCRPPFTLQRLCEILLAPRRYFALSRKLFNAVERLFSLSGAGAGLPLTPPEGRQIAPGHPALGIHPDPGLTRAQFASALEQLAAERKAESDREAAASLAIAGEHESSLANPLASSCDNAASARAISDDGHEDAALRVRAAHIESGLAGAIRSIVVQKAHAAAALSFVTAGSAAAAAPRIGASPVSKLASVATAAATSRLVSIVSYTDDDENDGSGASENVAQGDEGGDGDVDMGGNSDSAAVVVGTEGAFSSSSIGATVAAPAAGAGSSQSAGSFYGDSSVRNAFLDMFSDAGESGDTDGADDPASGGLSAATDASSFVSFDAVDARAASPQPPAALPAAASSSARHGSGTGILPPLPSLGGRSVVMDGVAYPAAINANEDEDVSGRPQPVLAGGTGDIASSAPGDSAEGEGASVSLPLPPPPPPFDVSQFLSGAPPQEEPESTSTGAPVAGLSATFSPPQSLLGYSPHGLPSSLGPLQPGAAFESQPGPLPVRHGSFGLMAHPSGVSTMFASPDLDSHVSSAGSSGAGGVGAPGVGAPGVGPAGGVPAVPAPSALQRHLWHLVGWAGPGSARATPVPTHSASLLPSPELEAPEAGPITLAPAQAQRAAVEPGSAQGTGAVQERSSAATAPLAERAAAAATEPIEATAAEGVAAVAEAAEPARKAAGGANAPSPSDSDSAQMVELVPAPDSDSALLPASGPVLAPLPAPQDVDMTEPAAGGRLRAAAGASAALTVALASYAAGAAAAGGKAQVSDELIGPGPSKRPRLGPGPEESDNVNVQPILSPVPAPAAAAGPSAVE